MFKLALEKSIIPVLVCFLTVFLILWIRPSILVHSSSNKNCPYCLNKWLVSFIVLAVGVVAYLFVINTNIDMPQISVS